MGPTLEQITPPASCPSTPKLGGQRGLCLDYSTSSLPDGMLPCRPDSPMERDDPCFHDDLSSGEERPEETMPDTNNAAQPGETVLSHADTPAEPGYYLPFEILGQVAEHQDDHQDTYNLRCASTSMQQATGPSFAKILMSCIFHPWIGDLERLAGVASNPAIAPYIIKLHLSTVCFNLVGLALLEHWVRGSLSQYEQQRRRSVQRMYNYMLNDYDANSRTSSLTYWLDLIFARLVNLKEIVIVSGTQMCVNNRFPINVCIC